MDEHFSQNGSALQLPSFDMQGTHNYVPCLAENTFSQQYVVKPEYHSNYSLPQWIGYQNLGPNYVDYLLGNDYSNMQQDVSYESTGVGCSFSPKESFLNTNAHLPEPKIYQVPNEVVQYQPHMSASTSEIPTKPHKPNMGSKATDTDRRRRTRIAAALDALEHLLPHAKEGSKRIVIDDCIDYIKYLQLRMRELSQTRLGGEPTSSYLTYLEGWGAYLVNENTATGPLQDMLGQLLDENPSEAAMFLASRDLFMLPIGPN